MLGNIKSLPDYNSEVIFTLYSYIEDEDFDIIGLTEVNKYWLKVSFENTETCRFSKWFELTYKATAYSHVKHFEHTFLPGGVLQLTYNSLANRVYKKAALILQD